MPRRSLSIAQIHESMNDTCPLCGQKITPSQIRRLDFDTCRCPHCNGVYTPVAKGKWSQLSNG